MPAVDRPLTRRTAIAVGAAGAITLTACEPFSSPGGSPDQPDPDPDVALVDQTVAQITTTAALAAGVPPLVAMHEAHLAALDASSASASPSPSASPTVAPGSPQQVRAAERALQTYLVDASVRAKSGPLARLLASMSASVGQHLATLPKGAA